MVTNRLCGLVATALLAVGCAGAPTTRGLAEDAAAAMGGADKLRAVQTLVMSGGSGTRSRLGQSTKVGDADEAGQLKNVTETADLAGGRAALDYQIQMASGFGQHRTEVLTKKGSNAVGLEAVEPRPLAVMSPAGLFSWGTQNSPEMLLRRNVVTIMRAALDGASDLAPEDRQLDGRTYRYGTASLNGETIGLYFDAESRLLAAYETTDTETMLGDVAAQYALSDYRDVAGLRLPHKITIRKGGQPYSEVQFGGAAVNDASAEAVFAIPEAASAEVDKAIAAGPAYSPVAITKVADGVHFVRAYSHNSMVVEFPSYLVVVEAPYTEAQSLTLGSVLREQFPNKPVRYAAVTHHHYDHTGGVRGLAALGATILTEKGHEGVIRPLVETPHTNPPDQLETRRKGGQQVGAVEVFEGRKVIADGGQTLELHAVTDIPHVNPKVLAYVPTSRVLFQSDLFFPGTGGAPSPDAVALLQSVKKLNLRVDTNVGGHGGVGPFAELVKAGSIAPAATN